MVMSVEQSARSWENVRSPIYWALLGLVIERSGYGYELLKRFERSYGPTLPIKSDWHIYRALNGLREKGLVEEIPVDEVAQESAGRQPKPHYRATRDGFSLYRDWLIAQAPPQRSSSLLVRHLAALARRPRVALEIIDHYERAFLTEAEQVTSAEGRLDGGPAPTLADRLAIKEGHLASAVNISWLEYARAEFLALADSIGEPDEPA
jgi:DNA-binding PadR family transcriptional regulator